MVEARCRVLAALLLLAVAGGCDRGDASGEPEPTARPTPSPAAESPSPEAPEESTPPVTEPVEAPEPDPTEPAPELHLVGGDYEQVVRSYIAFRTWLFRHPDPDRFDDITHPDYDCYIQKDLLASYAAQGLRWSGDGPGIVVNEVEVVDDRARDLVHVQVTLERPEPGELVDADGTVHDEVEPREPWVEELVFLREDPESPWRLRDFTDRGPVEEIPDG